MNVMVLASSYLLIIKRLGKSVIKWVVFQIIMAFSVVSLFRRFGGMCCFRIQCDWIKFA